MMFEFTIGINITGKGESVTVGRRTRWSPPPKVKYERPDPVFNYVRRRNSAAICVIHTGVDRRQG
jgi:hypothetical protein